ncbi:MAG TPA: hypothetical protein VGC45_11240 [Gryllotalpicola sp.]
MNGALLDTTAIQSPIAVPFGHSRDFDIAGRAVTVARTETGLYLLIEDRRSAVIHPQPNGRYIVTGPDEADPRSEPVSYEQAVRICLIRLADRPETELVGRPME